METISIDHPRKGVGKLVLLGALMFGASLFVLLGTLFFDLTFRVLGMPSTGLGLLAGGVGTIFFGYAFFFSLNRYFNNRGALVITPEGIINRTNAIGTKDVIPFSDMEKAQYEMIQGNPQIGIKLYDHEKYLNSLPWLKRKTVEINHNSFGTSIISLDVPTDSRDELHELVDIINHRIELAQEKTI